LPPCCCNSRVVHGYLTAGPPSTSWRLRPTARCSTDRSDRPVMRIRTKCTPARRAAKYLERIAALTGAKHEGDGSYRLTVGRRDFIVDPRLVCAISSRDQSTCFYVATDREIPSAEVVASALLELKNNPKLFEKWRERRGCTFKANGKMFKGIHRGFCARQL